MATVENQVRHFEDTKFVHHGRHDGGRQRKRNRAKLQFLQEFLVLAELARTECGDLGLVTELFIRPFGKFIRTRQEKRSGRTHMSELELNGFGFDAVLGGDQAEHRKCCEN